MSKGRARKASETQVSGAGGEHAQPSAPSATRAPQAYTTPVLHNMMQKYKQGRRLMPEVKWEQAH